MSELRRVPPLRRKALAHPAGSLAAALRGTGIAPAPLVASAQPFDPATGNGIRWRPDTLDLWLRGDRLDVAEVATTSPRDCWQRLAFVEAFPIVTHWWFGSPWTQRVRATHSASRPAGGHMVWLQAVHEDADALPWVVQPDGSAHGPLPDYSGGALNVPLALRMGELARLALFGQLAIGQWALVTSLVAAHDLPTLLGDTQRSVLLAALEGAYRNA